VPLVPARCCFARRAGFQFPTINSNVQIMFGQVYSCCTRPVDFAWAVIVADNGRTYTALHDSATPTNWQTMRPRSRVQFDVDQVGHREVVRNLQLADPTVAITPRKLKAG
jgi:hypothetical protein